MSEQSPQLFKRMQRNPAPINKTKQNQNLQCLLSKKKLPDMNQAGKYDPQSV